MPVLIIPLSVNMLLSGSIWMGEMPTALKVILTVITVVKFSLFVASGFFCEVNWLKKTGFVGCFLLNAFLAIMGISHNALGVVLFPCALIVMFFIWVILPRILVREEKDGNI